MAEEEAHDEHIFFAGVMIIGAFLLIYMTIGALMEKTKPIFGHEASYTLILGAIFSYILYISGYEHITEMLMFTDSFFFYYCMPPLVFAAGYNMKRKMFFKNLTNVVLFGVFSTFI